MNHDRRDETSVSLRHQMSRALVELLFWRAPEPPDPPPDVLSLVHRPSLWTTDDALRAAFPGVRYPKYALLHHLVSTHAYALHGSSQAGLTVIHPLTPLAEPGEQQRLLFATCDPFLAMFYALIPPDMRFYPFLSFRSYLAPYDPRIRYYYFSVHARLTLPALRHSGYIYVVPRAGFQRLPAASSRVTTMLRLQRSDHEWVSDQSVRPLMSCAVSLSDFPLPGLLGHYRYEPSVTRLVRFSAMLKLPWLSRSLLRGVSTPSDIPTEPRDV